MLTGTADKDFASSGEWQQETKNRPLKKAVTLSLHFGSLNLSGGRKDIHGKEESGVVYRRGVREMFKGLSFCLLKDSRKYVRESGLVHPCINQSLGINETKNVTARIIAVLDGQMSHNKGGNQTSFIRDPASLYL